MPKRCVIILIAIFALPLPVLAAGESAALKVQEAAAALVRGNTNQAVASYTEALADTTLQNDRRATILNDRGVAYARLGQTKLAIDDFNKAVQLFPEYAAVYNNRGNLLLALGVVKEAIKDFDRALILAPGYAAAYNNRAGAQARLGQHATAIGDYTRAVQLMPTNAAPLSGRGRAHLALGRPHAAIRDFSRAVNADARFAAGYRNRAEAKLDVGHYEEAIEDLSRAVAFDAGHADIYLLRGQAYLAMGNTVSAIKDFSSAIELAPEQSVGYQARGLAHARAQAFEEAFSDLNRAIELDPRSSVAFAYRAFAYKQSGQIDVGRRDIETAVKLEPDRPEVLWAKAEIAEATGRTEDAVADLKRAVAAKPGFKAASEALDRLAPERDDSQDKVVAGSELSGWRIVMRSGRYFAINDSYRKLRVPLEMMGEGEPKLVNWEVRDKPLNGIAVLTFTGGAVAGRSGPEQTELAAIVDLNTDSVVAIEPHRQGEKTSTWSWDESKVTVASVDGVTDEFVLRNTRLPLATTGRRITASDQYPSGTWAPWDEPWAGPRPGDTRRPRATYRKKPKTIFDLLFN